MLNSLVDSSKCARVKKRVYMPRVADEYNSSSQPLNGKEVANVYWNLCVYYTVVLIIMRPDVIIIMCVRILTNNSDDLIRISVIHDVIYKARVPAVLV